MRWCETLSRDWVSVAAELSSGTKLVSLRSLIYPSLDTEPLSIHLSLYLALIALPKSPPSVVLHNTYAHQHKYTPVFAKGEREGWRETIGTHHGDWHHLLFCYASLLSECLLTTRFQAAESNITQLSFFCVCVFWVDSYSRKKLQGNHQILLLLWMLIEIIKPRLLCSLWLL